VNARSVLLATSLLAVAAAPLAAQLPQNPAPVLESIRAHERLERTALPGTVRSFTGPAARTVDVFVPDAVPRTGAVHVVVHFHGASWLPHQAVARADSTAVAVAVNLGAGSAAYERPFAAPAAFDSLLDGVTREVAAVTGAEPRIGSITVSAFSAGYGAVRALLREPRHFARIDALLLLDGLHTSYVPEATPLADGGALDTMNLVPFRAYAREAAQGSRRLLITHSEIFPGTYASTTETADWLIRELGLRRTAVLQWGPRGMQQLAETVAGGFTVRAFAGTTAPDHIDHLHALPELLRAVR
jgi:hypothetical protein